ncbi:hypothetical protein KC334_g21624 [Hortaea werneckii]|nr:hypothetical protein KC334_g21624 [Hortaea werneckii]
MSAEPPASVSNTRLYLGNLPRNATKADVENHFNTHGTGEITEIKLMNGFGFIEYKDSMDARDVVPALTPTSLSHDVRSANSACSIPYVNPYPRSMVPNSWESV